jgi:hypothetical protein
VDSVFIKPSHNRTKLANYKIKTLNYKPKTLNYKNKTANSKTTSARAINIIPIPVTAIVAIDSNTIVV